jgi:hypothetical protein
MDITTATRASFGADQIPGYRLVRFLDQGGMGGVYLAEDENLKRLVAIKVINADLTDNPEFKRRFTNEAVIIAAFQHSNIVTVFASGWLGEKPYFVMEYVSGGTLSHRMETERLAEQSAYRIGFQMADALAYSHERNVIHRDFKPNNILLRENGTPVLSDFGIAKSGMQTGTKTEIGTVIGSPLYMAPEQALGEKISNRVDIYSFGLVLHQMLLGKLPARHPILTGEDERTITPSLRHIVPACADLIRRCLQAVPEARPTAVECRDVLSGLVQRSARWNLGWLLGLLVGGIAAAAALGLAAWHMGVLGRNAAAPPEPKPAASAPAPGVVSLAVQRFPSSAKVFLDGHEVNDALLSVDRGQHEMLAVAAGYYGRIEHIGVTRGVAANQIDLTLQPTVLPTRDETQRFLKLTESQALTLAEVQSISERTLRNALLAQQLSQTDHLVELESLSRDVDTLRRFGDSRAAVTALLIDSMRAGRITRGLVTQSLIAASDGGDPMASLFMAVAYRESINSSSSSVAASDPQFQSYCQRMGLAAAQGWGEVATEYWKRDHCIQ